MASLTDEKKSEILQEFFDETMNMIRANERRSKFKVVQTRMGVPERGQMTDENDPRIERVARALCQSEGKDPDAEHQTSELETKRMGSNATEFGNKSIPNWHDCVKEARKFVAAFDALHTNS